MTATFAATVFMFRPSNEEPACMGWEQSMTFVDVEVTGLRYAICSTHSRNTLSNPVIAQKAWAILVQRQINHRMQQATLLYKSRYKNKIPRKHSALRNLNHHISLRIFPENNKKPSPREPAKNKQKWDEKQITERYKVVLVSP